MLQVRLNVNVQSVNGVKKLILIRQTTNRELANLILTELEKNKGFLPCVVEVDRTQLQKYIDFFK